MADSSLSVKSSMEMTSAIIHLTTIWPLSLAMMILWCHSLRNSQKMHILNSFTYSRLATLKPKATCSLTSKPTKSTTNLLLVSSKTRKPTVPDSHSLQSHKPSWASASKNYEDVRVMWHTPLSSSNWKTKMFFSVLRVRFGSNQCSHFDLCPLKPVSVLPALRQQYIAWLAPATTSYFLVLLSLFATFTRAIRQVSILF